MEQRLGFKGNCRDWEHLLRLDSSLFHVRMQVSGLAGAPSGARQVLSGTGYRLYDKCGQPASGKAQLEDGLPVQ